MSKAGSENETSVPVSGVASLMPHMIDPMKWADRGITIKLTQPLQRFQRLLAGALSEDGEVQVHVRFTRDANGYAQLNGELSTQLLLTCQRCLEPVSEPVVADVSVYMLTDESYAERLREDQEYVVYSQGHIDLPELLEDELILALPLVARHEDCEPQVALSEPEIEPVPAKKENPFLVLAGLKQSDTK